MAGRRKVNEEKKVLDATVIDQSILTKAVKDYLNENKIIPKQSINFGKIKVLSLSFSNIWKIQYLQSLVRLEKLQLDNNIIEKIQNLGHLTNLVWLDLSFNQIKTIEGLDNLVNLKDLSLYNNKITNLDGLFNCPKLNIFSIGNNNIKSFEEIISYFGKGSQKKIRFKYLQVLNVYGNPFTIKDGVRDKQYQYHLIAHLPNLRYLDYIFIDEKKRKQIRDSDDKFKTEDQSKFLQQLKLEEDKEKQLEEEKRKKQNAKMHLLDGFSEDIVKIDDLEKIRDMRNLEEQIIKFSSKIKELIEPMQKRIKDQNQKKLQDIRKSENKLFGRQKHYETKALQYIEQFETEKKKYNKIFQNKYLYKNWKQEAAQLRKKIGQLKDKLLNIQVQMMEDAQQLFKKEILDIFQVEGKKILAIMTQDQKDEKSEQTGYFKKIDDEIKDFCTKMEKITKQETQRFINMENAGQNVEQFSTNAELNTIMQNRDSIPTMTSNIREMLVEKKTKKQADIESELISRHKQKYQQEFAMRQYERNRKNVRNINQKINKLYKQLDDIIERNDDEDDM